MSGKVGVVWLWLYFLVDGCEFCDLSSGDEVQFKTMFSQRSQKDSAIYVKKITTPQVRPERLRQGSTKGASTLVYVSVISNIASWLCLYLELLFDNPRVLTVVLVSCNCHTYSNTDTQ